MVCENLMCSGLPSPVLHWQAHPPTAAEKYHYFPEPTFGTVPVAQPRVGSLDSNESQTHENEVNEVNEPLQVVLTRGEEACGGAGKRGSWVGRRGGSVKWKGIDV